MEYVSQKKLQNIPLELQVPLSSNLVKSSYKCQTSEVQVSLKTCEVQAAYIWFSQFNLLSYLCCVGWSAAAVLGQEYSPAVKRVHIVPYRPRG